MVALWCVTKAGSKETRWGMILYKSITPTGWSAGLPQSHAPGAVMGHLYAFIASIFPPQPLLLWILPSSFVGAILNLLCHWRDVFFLAPLSGINLQSPECPSMHSEEVDSCELCPDSQSLFTYRAEWLAAVFAWGQL